MQRNMLFIGGDLRNVELMKLYAKEECNIYAYGFENYNFENEKIVKVDNLDIATDVAISSIPFSKDGKFIKSSFNNAPIEIETVFNKLKGKTIIAGAVKDEVLKTANKYQINLIDIMKNEELTILNVIPTAEGAIQIAMEESIVTLHGNKCLVLGYGRIGKVLSKMLNGIGAKVYCEARKDKDLAYIRAYGYNPIDLEELNKFLPQFKYIFNTIPSLILDKEKLEYINRDTIIIDLASSPGGVDFEYAKEKGIKSILALGLPGKVAPHTTAEYIKEVLNKIEI